MSAKSFGTSRYQRYAGIRSHFLLLFCILYEFDCIIHLYFQWVYAPLLSNPSLILSATSLPVLVTSPESVC